MTLYVKKLVSPIQAEPKYRMLPLSIALAKYHQYCSACMIDPMSQGIASFDEWLVAPDMYGVCINYWKA